MKRQWYWVYMLYLVCVVVAYLNFAVDLVESKGIGNISGSIIFFTLYFLPAAWVLLMKKRSLWFLLSGLIPFPPVLSIYVIALKSKA
jgi:hypothetical protein